MGCNDTDRRNEWAAGSIRRLYSEPLVSGSEAIMPFEQTFVKRFVVFFLDYYTKV